MTMNATETTRQLPWVESDGGRKAAGYRGEVDDCVTRTGAHLLAHKRGITGSWTEEFGAVYRETYRRLTEMNREWLEQQAWYWKMPKGQQSRERSVRTGIHTQVFYRWLEEQGLIEGGRVRSWPGGRLDSENPLIQEGAYAVHVIHRREGSSMNHMFAVIDGQIYDNGDPQETLPPSHTIEQTWELR